MSEKIFTVSGMTCGHCVQAVTEEVTKVPGVTEVEIDLDSGRLTVRGDAIDEAEVAAAVDEAGYALSA